MVFDGGVIVASWPVHEEDAPTLLFSPDNGADVHPRARARAERLTLLDTRVVWFERTEPLVAGVHVFVADARSPVLAGQPIGALPAVPRQSRWCHHGRLARGVAVIEDELYAFVETTSGWERPRSSSLNATTSARPLELIRCNARGVDVAQARFDVDLRELIVDVTQCDSGTCVAIPTQQVDVDEPYREPQVAWLGDELLVVWATNARIFMRQGPVRDLTHGPIGMLADTAAPVMLHAWHDRAVLIVRSGLHALSVTRIDNRSATPIRFVFDTSP